MRSTRTAGFHLLAGGLSVLWLLPILLVLTTSVRSFSDIASNGLGALPRVVHSRTVSGRRGATAAAGTRCSTACS